jgi:uncharacterized protein YgiM (DUF1202 family)
MNIRAGSLVRVVADYQAPFPDPIRGKAGETVSVDLEKKTNIAGWVWCTGRGGRSGWVPEAYLERWGNTGRLRCDYDAIELSIFTGETLTVSKMESGFYWATSQDGRQGWVPVDHVKPCPQEPESEEK